MSYDDVAHARGTSRDAAIRWVQRRKLRRQPGNDGRVRVLVPGDIIRMPMDQVVKTAVEHVPHTAPSPVAEAKDELARAFGAAVAGLVERAERAEAEVDQLRQAEAERKGQGRWQRIRAAWRGT